MTQTKKKTLIVLVTTLILLLAMVVSLVGQNQSGMVASADSTTTQVNATQQTLKNVMSKGKAPTPLTNSGTAIGTAQQLRTFLESGSGVGYLTGNINDFYWEDGRLTGLLASANMTALDGNGYTITLTAN